jgi:hypothetical protein
MLRIRKVKTKSGSTAIQVVHYTGHSAKIVKHMGGVLGLVFFQDIGLDGAADPADRIGLDFFIDLGRKHLVAGDARQH